MPEEIPIVINARGSENNLLQVVLSIFRGRRYLDIRRYFKASDGSMSPTRKGIALSLNDFNFIMKTLEANETQVSDWLDLGEDEVRLALTRAQAAEEWSRYEAKSFIRSVREERTLTFFSISEEGGKVKLIYNSSHPLYGELEQALASSPTDSRFLQLFDFILVSYARCRGQFKPDQKVEADELFEMLDNEWGRVLRRYIEESK